MLFETTKKQDEVLKYWKKQTQKTGIPPGIREAAEYFGYEAPGSISHLLRALEKKGLMKKLRHGYWVVVDADNRT